MPVQRYVLDGRPGFKWGERGTCYTYAPNNDAGREHAREKAEQQGHAVKAAQNRRDS